MVISNGETPTGWVDVPGVDHYAIPRQGSFKRSLFKLITYTHLYIANETDIAWKELECSGLIEVAFRPREGCEVVHKKLRLPSNSVSGPRSTYDGISGSHADIGRE